MTFSLRLTPEQKRDLEILKDLLDGQPPVNGLIQTAIRQYIEAKLSGDSALRKAYNRRLDPRLEVAS